MVIAISVVQIYYENHDHDMEIFDTEEQARIWFYTNFIDNKTISTWWDSSFNFASRQPTVAVTQNTPDASVANAPYASFNFGSGFMHKTPEDIKKVLDTYTLDQIAEKCPPTEAYIIIHP